VAGGSVDRAASYAGRPGLQLTPAHPVPNLPTLTIIGGGAANCGEFFIDPLNRPGLGNTSPSASRCCSSPSPAIIATAATEALHERAFPAVRSIAMSRSRKRRCLEARRRSQFKQKLQDIEHHSSDNLRDDVITRIRRASAGNTLTVKPDEVIADLMLTTRSPVRGHKKMIWIVGALAWAAPAWPGRARTGTARRSIQRLRWHSARWHGWRLFLTGPIQLWRRRRSRRGAPMKSVASLRDQQQTTCGDTHMHTTHARIEGARERSLARLLAPAVVALLMAGHPQTSSAHTSQPKTFASAGEASEALFQAVRSHDEPGIEAILGAGKEIASTGDDDGDTLERERFCQKYQEMHRLVREPDGTTVVYIGAENWPFPIPLTAHNGRWSLNAQTGRQEIPVPARRRKRGHGPRRRPRAGRGQAAPAAGKSAVPRLLLSESRRW
jgi:hypothetical protein